MNTKEIQAEYLKLHNELGPRITYKWFFPKDSKQEFYEEFDIAHAKIWADCDDELEARKKELKDNDKLEKEEARELSDLTMLFPEPSPLGRDLAKEIDELKEKVKKLEK